MGICPSKYHVPYKYFPELVAFRKTFQCLGITDREVGKIYKIFKSIDIDESKEIDIAEVLVHLHVEKTFFNKRVFGLLDSDASGELNFEEFAVGLWNYCSVENTHFEHFAFDLYDADHSGHIDIEEAQFMVKDIYGEEFEHNVHARRAYHKLAELEVSKIDFPTFLEFTHKHQAMLYPAFALQMSLKKYIMGVSFWQRQAQHRLRISNGEYKTVTDLIGKTNFHKKRQLHKRDSDLINMFRKGSLQKSDPDIFTAPGAAYRPDVASYDSTAKRKGSKEMRKGSNGKISDVYSRRGSKTGGTSMDEKAGARRGSKTVITGIDDPLHGQEKAGARRGSKTIDIEALSSDPIAAVRRGSKIMNSVSPRHGEGPSTGRRGSKFFDHDSPTHEKAGARRGSKIIDNDSPSLGYEKAGARRGSKLLDNVNDSPNHKNEKAGARRGSKDNTQDEKKRKHSKNTVIPVTTL